MRSMVYIRLKLKICHQTLSDGISLLEFRVRRDLFQFKVRLEIINNTVLNDELILLYPQIRQI